MNVRNWLRSNPTNETTTRSRRSASKRTPRRHLAVEVLEDRAVPASVSVGDAVGIEGSAALKILDRFVTEGSGGLARPRSSVFGPDANGDGVQEFYLGSVDNNQILRYDGRTGASMGSFVTSGSGGLNSPSDLAFGSDGMLYVTSLNSGELLRYDGATGAFVDRIASGLLQPLGLAFGNDGNLYIANQGTNEVLRYNSSGMSVFVSAGSGGLAQPRHGVFGPDGNLYVASSGTKQVLRYDGLTGTFINVFATTNLTGLGNGPGWLEFGGDGYLYAASPTTPGANNYTIIRFNATTGAFVDSFAMAGGWSFIFGPDRFIYDSGNGNGNFVDRIGPSSLAVFAVSLDSASAVPVTVDFSTASGTATAGSDFTPASGTLTLAPGQTKRTVVVQTLNDAVSEPTETFFLNLDNSVGATITDGQAIATISDDDPADTTAPTVTGVFFDGSAWATAFRTAAGNSTFGFPAQTGAGQLTDMPWSNVNTIYVQFSEPVNAVTAAQVGVRGINVPNYTVSSVTMTSATVAKITLSAGFDTDRIILDLDGSSGVGVSDLAGNKLAGTWTEGVSTFPTAGAAAVDFKYRFVVAVGDADRNGLVRNADVNLVRANLFVDAGQAGYNIYSDIDGNGLTRNADVNVTRSHLFVDPPAGPGPNRPVRGGAAGSRDQHAIQTGSRYVASGLVDQDRTRMTLRRVPSTATAGVLDRLFEEL